MPSQEYHATIAEMLQKSFLVTCKWIPTRFREAFRNVEMTSAVFQLAASFFDFSGYVTMLLTLLCLPNWTLLEFVALSCYKTMYTAQLLYIPTFQSIFGQHYEIEALISELEVSPAVWDVLIPEYRDRAKKESTAWSKKMFTYLKVCKKMLTYKYGIALSIQINYWMLIILKKILL